MRLKFWSKAAREKRKRLSDEELVSATRDLVEQRRNEADQFIYSKVEELRLRILKGDFTMRSDGRISIDCNAFLEGHEPPFDEIHKRLQLIFGDVAMVRRNDTFRRWADFHIRLNDPPPAQYFEYLEEKHDAEV